MDLIIFRAPLQMGRSFIRRTEEHVLRDLHEIHAFSQVDVAIQRAKEYECDTCIRLSVALADPNIVQQRV